MNAELNHISNKVHTVKNDVFEQVKLFGQTNKKFDVVIADPPAFIKRRKDFKAGERAYRKFNELAMRLVTRDGLLITSSCSMHMQRETLVDVVRGATRHIDRFSQIIDQSSQGPDHPIHPAIPETEYLKSLFVRVLRL
jgi:23S rRNA (cytosine1962-C5)-methyltransferase